MDNFPKTLLLVYSWVKIQYARDDEGPYFCKNLNNIDNDLYCSSNEFSNHLALLTVDKAFASDLYGDVQPLAFVK